jgi:hypothetical protein
MTAGHQAAILARPAYQITELLVAAEDRRRGVSFNDRCGRECK